MKKLPRKFSEGGKTASAPQPKPQDKKDSMPDWAKKDLEQKNQDAKTKAGYEKATAPDRLKNYKAGGKVRKFAEGDEVKGRFSESDPDIYKRALSSVARRNAEEAGEAGSIKEPPGAEKPATKAAEKPATKAAEKPATKTVAKPVAKPVRSADKPASKKEDSDESAEVNARIKNSLARMESKALADAQERFNKSSYAQRRSGGFGGTEPDVPYTDVSPTKSKPASKEDPSSVNQRLRRFFGDLEARELARSRVRAGLMADPSQVYKSGGKVAKYAKGGGVESKGKTKGTVVKMASGGSVKGWGIARGSKACKMK
jgi:hypothetical protein